MATAAILVLNAGSSGRKFARFDGATGRRELMRGAVKGIGTGSVRLAINRPDRSEEAVGKGSPTGRGEALDAVLRTLSATGLTSQLGGVGHPAAHGGPDCGCPMPVTPGLVAKLRRLIPLAALDLPANIAGIEAASALCPELGQVACFDTAFHATPPPVARMTGPPRAMATRELRRYGYHGLSCEYVVGAPARDGVDLAAERIVVAHLRNGPSLTAIRHGGSVETTMGFSTISGVPVRTRPGDVDPGLLPYLQTVRGLPAEELGCLGIGLDAPANAENRRRISRAGAPVVVEVRPTDEEAVIAGHVARLCAGVGRDGGRDV